MESSKRGSSKRDGKTDAKRATGKSATSKTVPAKGTAAKSSAAPIGVGSSIARKSFQSINEMHVEPSRLVTCALRIINDILGSSIKGIAGPFVAEYGAFFHILLDLCLSSRECDARNQFLSFIAKLVVLFPVNEAIYQTLPIYKQPSMAPRGQLGDVSTSAFIPTLLSVVHMRLSSSVQESSFVAAGAQKKKLESLL